MKPKSTSAKLRELMEQSELPHCVAITAPDSIRLERAFKFIVEKFTKIGAHGRTFTFGESSRETLSRFLQELLEPSLFEPVRFGVLRNIGKTKVAELEPLVKFITASQTQTTVVLLGESLPNNQALKKAVDAKGAHIAFEPLKGAELARWVEREFSQAGIKDVDDDIVEQTLSIAGDSPEVAASIIEKYALFLDGDAPNKASLRQMFPERAVASDFELAETLLTARRDKSEILLQHLFDQGSSPFMLMGLLSKTCTTLLRIKTLTDRGIASSEIRTQLGVSPWLFNKYAPLAKRLSRVQLAENLSHLMETDYRLKDRSLGPQTLFSKLAKDLKPKS